MRLIRKHLLLLPVLLLACSANSSKTNQHDELVVQTSLDSNKTSRAHKVSDIQVPDNYARVSYPSHSFSAWLQSVKLSQNDTVYLHNGHIKRDQQSHLAVLDFDIGKRDLQQCADAVIRLRAEYLWASGQKDKIAFHFTSGHLVKWTQYAKGYRPKIKGSQVTFAKTAPANSSYASFRRYLDLIFTYCGTYSLHKELVKVKNENELEVGDVFIQTGQPYGHAVIVMDCAKNSKGEKAYLLAQSYMPAQSIHILLDPEQNYRTAWYRVDSKSIRETPHWTFDKSDLRRFP